MNIGQRFAMVMFPPSAKCVDCLSHGFFHCQANTDALIEGDGPGMVLKGTALCTA
jgi:hypothetical protein